MQCVSSFVTWIPEPKARQLAKHDHMLLATTSCNRLSKVICILQKKRRKSTVAVKCWRKTNSFCLAVFFILPCLLIHHFFEGSDPSAKIAALEWLHLVLQTCPFTINNETPHSTINCPQAVSVTLTAGSCHFSQDEAFLSGTFTLMNLYSFCPGLHLRHDTCTEPAIYLSLWRCGRLKYGCLLLCGWVGITHHCVGLNCIAIS